MKEYIINPITRKLSPVDKEAALGVYNDNDTDGAFFRMKGAIVPMLTSFNARVNYQNANEDRVEIYRITDVVIDGDELTCSWILEREATNNIGDIIFTVCFTKSDGSEWNTTIYKDRILEGLEPSPSNEPTEEEKETYENLYQDAVERFYQAADEKKAQVLDDIRLNTYGLVKSINGQTPDESGNVNIETGDGGSGYNPPPSGIPKSDLSDGVQRSLNKADTALQEVPEGYVTSLELANGYYDKSEIDRKLQNITSGGVPGSPVVSSDESYVLIESFGGGTDKSASENDNAFKLALRTGKPIKFSVPNGDYYFSENIIDPKDPTIYTKYGSRIEIDFNYAKIHNLCFRWNMKSDGEPYVTSSVGFAYLTLRNAFFIGNTERPAVLSATGVRVINCNTGDMIAVVGYTSRYVDFFLAEEGQCYRTKNYLVTVDYDGNILHDGAFGDWFTFKRIHFSSEAGYVTKPFTASLINDDKNGGNHKSTVYFDTCLHGWYEIYNSEYTQNKYTFDHCHFEGASKMVNVNPEWAIEGFVKMNDCFMYSTFLPDDMRGIDIIGGSEINYGNNGNPSITPLQSGSWTRMFNGTEMSYDDTKFLLGLNRSSTPYAPSAANFYTFTKPRANAYRKFSDVKSIKYAMATSLVMDKLWYNGATPTIAWSNSVSSEINRSVAVTGSMASGKTDNIYLHVFRQIGDTVERVVLPITKMKYDWAANNGKAFVVVDGDTDVYGYPWEEYTGSVAFSATR